MNIINIKTDENITYKLYYNNTKEETWGVELEQLLIEELEEIYAISSVKKEFRKAVDEAWREKAPWQRYQKKLIADLAVLE